MKFTQRIKVLLIVIGVLVLIGFIGSNVYDFMQVNEGDKQIHVTIFDFGDTKSVILNIVAAVVIIGAIAYVKRQVTQSQRQINCEMAFGTWDNDHCVNVVEKIKGSIFKKKEKDVASIDELSDPII